MSTPTRSTAPNISPNLLVEQASTQANKIRHRTLTNYDAILFEWPVRDSESTAGVFNDDGILHDLANNFSLGGILWGMRQRITNRPTHWVDIGAGLAIAMREYALAQNSFNLGKAALTAVDLFDWEKELGSTGIQAYIERLGFLADLFEAPQCKPSLVLSDAEKLCLSEPADLITCVEATQYFDDPIAVVANSYNLLADDGIMIFGRMSSLSDRITQEGQAFGEPFRGISRSLDEAGIKHTFNWAASFVPDFRSLAIRKKPQTHLATNAAPTSVHLGHDGVKYVEYEGLMPLLKVDAVLLDII